MSHNLITVVRHFFIIRNKGERDRRKQYENRGRLLSRAMG